MSKMGERTLRRLLIIGASSVVRQAVSRGAPAGSWLTRMLAKKPRMLVIVALANKMARIVWALMVRGEFIELRPQPCERDCGSEAVEDVRRSTEGMAQRSVRRGRENQSRLYVP
jgi:hypothetical protein